MTELTRENICEYLEANYNSMMDSYDDTVLNEVKIIIERLKRDSTIANVKLSVDDLQAICNILYRKYHDDDVIIEFQFLINQLANLFNIGVENPDGVEVEDGE